MSEECKCKCKVGIAELPAERVKAFLEKLIEAQEEDEESVDVSDKLITFDDTDEALEFARRCALLTAGDIVEFVWADGSSSRGIFLRHDKTEPPSPIIFFHGKDGHLHTANVPYGALRF